MLALLVLALLAAVGVLLAYRFSPAAKLKARLRKALSPFEDLDSEIRGLQQTLKNETESLTDQYIRGVYSSRLKAIPVDELKKYASGMRLQALKDVGARTVADLQGWNEFRVSQVRGVGPKSASAIVRSVAAIIAAAKAIPIPHPSPPFSVDSERQLMQALYRQRWFGTHVSDSATAFAATVTSQQCARDAILAKATFAHWLWKFGTSSTIRTSLEEADALIGALADTKLRGLKEALSRSLSDCRAICANRVPVELIAEDFKENRSFYVAYLISRLGPLNSTTPTEPAPRPEANKVPTSDVVHVEFGRVVPGPPPEPTGAGLTNSQLHPQNPQQTEKLISVTVGSTSGRTVTEFTLPSPPRPAVSSKLRWLTKGESIEIQGHTLTHGFVYIGSGNDSEAHYALNPWLSAKGGATREPWLAAKNDASAPADVSGYYFSFATLSPEQRSCFLDWLAQGASSSTEPGFAMMYFYGLERRVIDLLQKRVSDLPGGEMGQLLEEVHRLGSLFKDKPGSVTLCCLRLSDFAAASALDGISTPELSKEWVKTWELPFSVRYGIGWFMKDRKPIPVDWALRWAYVEPTIYLRTPATRCPQEFEAAFSAVYRKKFGDGVIVPANKTKLKLAYQPGWPTHFGGEIRREFSGIPDVAAVTAPQQTLKALVEEATAEIDAYSRYLGRNPAKAGTLEAYLNLPLHLWSSEVVTRWRQFLASVVEPVQPILLETLLRELGYVGEPGLARLPDIAMNLSRASVGFEPDILAGARRPKPSEPVVLFPLTLGCGQERPAAEYKRASLIVSLSACVALADGHASEEEAAAVEVMIASWQHLHADLQTRLRAQYRLQVQNQISLASLKSRFANLTPNGRTQLAHSLCSLAAADGNIAAAEVKLLEQIYRALALDLKLLYSHLNLGAQQLGGSESQKSMVAFGAPAYTVDATRLATLRQETEQVSALLAEVFTEEELSHSPQTDAVGPDSSPTKTSEDVVLPGLDSKLQRFLEELLRKASWTRKELQSMAAQSQIMLDGALERINDAAFDLVGEPVTEGDDPVYVQQNILEVAE